ncbi:hypothetical protein E5S67_05916 [Microcoleus sp. IPMA8]|uniref:Uncharacterized protein n=1 Tax=Microcoleus asticus IPMA8 TaxID=2563858 RepID=A0ABX2D846_9CYAN|nr:hypothetical protein [Microcoleus asticus IPMA8]
MEYPAAINLTPYQGLKPEFVDPEARLPRIQAAINLTPYQGLKLTV